jgi:hypothetical protein
MAFFIVGLQRHAQPSPHNIVVLGNPALGVRAQLGRLRINARFTDQRLGCFYRDLNSFVILFGQAHWKGEFSRHVGTPDLAKLLEAHRAGHDPRLRDLAGNFCLLSYDGQTQSLWIGSDLWGTAAPYYGEKQSEFVVSSRAGVVAEQVKAAIDGISYVTLMRDATLPSGRTLFHGVQRVALGHAIRLDSGTGKADIVSLGGLYRAPLDCTFRESVEYSMRVIVPAITLAASVPDTVVDLSAGNDTRLSAAALTTRPDHGRGVRFRVTGEASDVDVVAAKRIAELSDWLLDHHPKEVVFSLNVKDLMSAAAAGDGSIDLLAIANRLQAEHLYAPRPAHLLGSTCGELFRNWIWQPEVLRMGQTRNVNFTALLQHRIRRDRTSDVRRLSNGALTIAEHDELLLVPYRELAARYPDALNTYKLDLMYILQLQNRIVWWPLAGRLSVEMPYLWSDVTEVSLRLPWVHKATRRLVTTIVESLAPRISIVPTDRRAPFRPLRLTTLGDYVPYLYGYVSDIARRHYFSKAPLPLQKPRRFTEELPREWADFLRGRALHDEQGLIDVATETPGLVSNSQRRELLTMLNVELLCQIYPSIERRLVFG